MLILPYLFPVTYGRGYGCDDALLLRRRRTYQNNQTACHVCTSAALRRAIVSSQRTRADTDTMPAEGSLWRPVKQHRTSLYMRNEVRRCDKPRVWQCVGNRRPEVLQQARLGLRSLRRLSAHELLSRDSDGGHASCLDCSARSSSVMTQSSISTNINLCCESSRRRMGGDGCRG